MTITIDTSQTHKTTELLATVLIHAKQGHRVQFLCDARSGPAVVQRLRVALSRSRGRHLARGKKIDEFTLCHSIHPHTENGKRYDAVVMWVVKTHHHMQRELLDDLLER